MSKKNISSYLNKYGAYFFNYKLREYIADKHNTLNVTSFNFAYDPLHQKKIIAFLTKNIPTLKPFIYEIDDTNKNIPIVCGNDDFSIFIELQKHRNYYNNYFYSYNFHYLGSKSEDIEKIINKTKKWKFVPKHNNITPQPKINFLIETNGQFSTMEFYLDEVTLDFKNDYELESDMTFEELLNVFSDPKSGFMLMNGDPGTGKTTLIKYLSQKLPHIKFVFVPNYVAINLSSPNFMPFVLNNLKNSVLILEDCEDILRDRKATAGNAATSTILNVTSGMLADVLNVKILSTQNTSDGIDPALLRKGRLLKRMDFKPLSPAKANVLAKRIEIEKVYDKPSTVADIYNELEDNHSQVKKSNPIGFRPMNTTSNVLGDIGRPLEFSDDYDEE